jgi:hypothetical protein
LRDWSHPSRDDLSQYTHDDFQSYLGICDAYPFEHSDFLYDEDFQPPLCSNFDGHKVMAIPEQSKNHTTKKQCFHLGDFCRDVHMKRRHILSVEKDYFFRPKFVPYLNLLLCEIMGFYLISHLLSAFKE